MLDYLPLLSLTTKFIIGIPFPIVLFTNDNYCVVLVKKLAKTIVADPL